SLSRRATLRALCCPGHPSLRCTPDAAILAGAVAERQPPLLLDADTRQQAMSLMDSHAATAPRQLDGARLEACVAYAAAPRTETCGIPRLSHVHRWTRRKPKKTAT